MSLTAVVFKGRSSVERQTGLRDFDVDTYTGEIIPSASSILEFKFEDAISKRVHFGNISGVSHIKK